MMAPTVMPNMAMEIATNAKWYHMVTLKMRVRTISYITVASATKKSPRYVVAVGSRSVFTRVRAPLLTCPPPRPDRGAAGGHGGESVYALRYLSKNATHRFQASSAASFL